jgi:hypothetical protein
MATRWPPEGVRHHIGRCGAVEFLRFGSIEERFLAPLGMTVAALSETKCSSDGANRLLAGFAGQTQAADGFAHANGERGDGF